MGSTRNQQETMEHYRMRRRKKEKTVNECEKLKTASLSLPVIVMGWIVD